MLEIEEKMFYFPNLNDQIHSLDDNKQDGAMSMSYKQIKFLMKRQIQHLKGSWGLYWNMRLMG